MKRLWREPLLPFAIIAGFLLWLQPPAHDNDLVIELSPEISSNLEADFKRQRRRPPTPSEVTELEETWVEMEILSREARQLGLDRNDPVVRRRLAQAMRFYLENGLPPAPPSEAEINAYIEANRDDLSLPRRRRFAHLFFSHQSRQAKAKEDAESALKILEKDKDKTPKTPQGDVFIHGRVIGPVDEKGLAKRLGNPFAKALFRLTEGPRWQGPLESNFGFHLIRLLGDQEPGLPKDDVLRAGVRRQLEKSAKNSAGTARLKALKSRYRIER